MIYKASKVRSSRPGWSVSFRHPLRKDSQGRPGLKVRRGLNTPDDLEADRLVSQLNEILGNDEWWTFAKHGEAQLRFSAQIVSAFYDEIEIGPDRPDVVREALIPMPRNDEGYAKVLFVGTTGAGKTSLLRQLIGSDPVEDRFPSTAPAKTTIADIEVILADGKYQSVVTFFSESQVKTNIEECVSDACMVGIDGDPSKIADRFLNHRDQKFRLNYILGNWQSDNVLDDDGLSFDGDLTTDETRDSPVELSEDVVGLDERVANFDVLKGYVRRIARLAKSVEEEITSEIGIDFFGDAKNPDSEAARQLFQESFDSQLVKADDFHELVNDVLDTVRQRFENISFGELVRKRNGWPELWKFIGDDRTEFLRRIRWFSSNYWPQFGRLLTPLVQGIRVKGPLYPDFARPKLVLIDGQGIGHSPDSSSSVTTHLTRQFPGVDVVLLVDNAQQPMQAGALSVLRTIASYGYHEKLAIAFTHFDQIRGDNLRSQESKRAHVMASVVNAMSHLSDTIGPPLARTMSRFLEDRCFMLPAIDRSLRALRGAQAAYVREQLSCLLLMMEGSVAPQPISESRPVYDPRGLSFAVQEAVLKFINPWAARLGIGTYEGVRKEHWTRIKALNRRIAGDYSDEYDNLRPVADLVARLSESVSRFLDNPTSWSGGTPDESERQSVISGVRQIVSTELHELANRRVIVDEIARWRDSIDGSGFSGTGSTFRRAAAISKIYDDAAPMPDAVMTSASIEFLTEIDQITVRAIERSGGVVQLSSAIR